MLQASLLDGLSFDPFSLQEDGLAAAEVDVGRREVVDALVIAAVVIVVDERRDLLVGRGQPPAGLGLGTGGHEPLGPQHHGRAEAAEGARMTPR